MKTPSTRQTILDATQRLIEKDGSTRLTTKQIAQGAHCAEGTLFNHFKNKEDLLLAVVLENAPKFRGQLAGVHAGQRSVTANLEEIGRAAIAFFEQLIPLAASLLADVGILVRHRKEMAAQDRGPRDVFEAVEAYISEEQKLRRIGIHIRPSSAAALLLGPCFHRAFMRHVMGKGLPSSTDREFVAALVATLIAGLRLSDDGGDLNELRKLGSGRTAPERKRQLH